jgi:hypothetical protein
VAAFSPKAKGMAFFERATLPLGGSLFAEGERNGIFRKSRTAKLALDSGTQIPYPGF